MMISRIEVLVLTLILWAVQVLNPDFDSKRDFQDLTSPVILRHEDPVFTISLPAGYRESPVSHPNVDYFFQRRIAHRPGDEEERDLRVAVQILPGPWQRSDRNSAEIARLEADAGRGLPPGATVRLQSGVWKDREIDLFECRVSVGGVDLFTLMAQVPLEPQAIQLTVSGEGPDENVVRAELDMILAGVGGESYVPTRAERRLAHAAVLTILFGGVLFLLEPIGTALIFLGNPGLLRRTRLVGLGLAIIVSLAGAGLVYRAFKGNHGMLLAPLVCAVFAAIRWTGLYRTSATEAPAVVEKKWTLRSAGGWLVVVAIAGISVLVITRYPESPHAWISLNVVLILILQALAIYPYSLGTALVARAVGFRVPQVALGIGRSRWKFRLGDTRLDLGPLPIGGTIDAGPLSFSLLRIRLILVGLAGAGTSVALLAIVVRLSGFRFDGLEELTTRLSPVVDLGIAVLILLVLNLFPRRLSIGNRNSDGLNVVRALFLSDEGKRDCVAMTYAIEAAHCLEDDHPAEALAWYDRGLSVHSKSPVLRHDRGAALIRLGRLDEAKQSFLALLGEENLQPFLRALALNNLASIDLLSPSRNDLLEEADRYSEESMGLDGLASANQTTRGAVLVERGRIEEGVALLRQALETVDRPSTKAKCLVYLGLAFHRQGRLEESRSSINQARSLYPHSPYLKRAEDI